MSEWDDPEPDTVLLTWPMFVVAPYPHPTATDELLASFVTGVSAAADGAAAEYVCVFTDLDLAQRFLSEHDLADDHRVLTFPDTANFAAALDGLAARGRTHVGVDPAYGRVRRIDIPAVAAAVRSAAA